MANVKCPECGERVRVRGDGKRLRCPECDTSFRPPDDDEDDEIEEEKSRRRQQKRRPAESTTSGTKIAAVIVGGLLLIGVVGLGIVLIVRNGGRDGNSPPIDSAKVTMANFKTLRPGMAVSEVESILGGSRESSGTDFRDAFNAMRRAGDARDANLGQTDDGTIWRRWEGKNLRLWVAFAPTKDGPRAAYSTALEELPGGGWSSEQGIFVFGGVRELEKMADDRKQESDIRNDAKWVRGAVAREWLIGEWRDDKANGYLFGQNDKLSELSLFPALPGREPTYRVVDDRYLDIITPSPFAPLPGHPAPPAFVNTQPTTARYEYFVNQDELALIGGVQNAVLGNTSPLRSLYRFPVRAGSAGEAKLVAPLLADLKGNDTLKQQSAYATLRHLAKGVAVALPTLTELLGGPDSTLIDLSTWIINDMKESAAPAVPALVALLRDPNSPRAVTAARVLGNIGPAARDALPALREVAKKAKDMLVRFEVEQSIRRIETGKF